MPASSCTFPIPRWLSPGESRRPAFPCPRTKQASKFVIASFRMQQAPRFVIARPRRGRGALSAQREEVPLGCNLRKALPKETGLRQIGVYPQVCHCEAPQEPWQSRGMQPEHGKAPGEIAGACLRLPRRFAPRNDTGRRHFQICHCEAPKGPWQSRGMQPEHEKAPGELVTACKRLPRRFAPRNDTGGRRLQACQCAPPDAQAPRLVIASLAQQGVAISGRHFRKKQAAVKSACTPDLSLRGSAITQ